MDSLKSLAILALLTIEGVNAGPCKRPSASTTTSLTSATPSSIILGSPDESTVSSCSFIELPKSFACNVEGDAGDLGEVLAEVQLSLPDCASYCAATDECKSFSVDKNNNCGLYLNGIPKANTRLDTTVGMFWYDMLCVRCNDGVRVLDLNFDDGNLDNWGLESDNLDDWALDIVPVNVSNKAPSNALRIMEAKPDGSVTVSYAPEIQLEAGATYKLAYTGRTSYVPMAVGHVDWGMVTVGLSGGAFSGPPENGVDLGLGWRRYESKFTVVEGQGGANFLTFDIKASGLMVNWYFEDILIWTA